MKISGKFILKVAGTLTVISLVVAALLGLGRTVKSIPLPHNSAFPGGQSVHQRTQPGSVGAALAVGLHVGFIGQGVRQRQLPVRLERLLQRQRHSRPPPPPQIHAEFICYSPPNALLRR